ncbi:PepSY domain-containing protein [Streptomyces sp. NPDC048389]|uniref:PepSY domain-containing protein n=1 Tax=Streptomyces sp. NPDC048389 TaxID=3154622 RepID=UPI0034552B7B
MNVSTHARRLRTAIPGCLIACSALLLTACGSDKGTEVSAAAPAQTGSPTGTASPTGSPSPTDSPTRLTDDQAERRALVPAATVTWGTAADTAADEVPGSQLVEIELTRYQNGGTASPYPSPSPSPASPSPSPSPSPGTPAWAVDVATEDGTVHIVHVDAASGEVLGSRQESDQDADDKRQTADRLAQAEITPEEAVRTATERTDGTVTAVELENDDADKLIWSVEVVTEDDWNKTTFDIDATNGEILREQVDRD